MIGVDTKLGQMLAAIDPTETYVFLLSDNGTPANVPPSSTFNGYKTTQWQGGIHVPLVVWGPNVTSGLDDSLVQIVDLPGTLAELAGVPPAAGLEDSISFVDSLRGGAGGRRAAFVQRFAPNDLGAPLTGHEWAVVRADGWKLLVEGPGLSLGSPPALFNLDADPTEQSPVVDARLTAELLAIRDAILGPDWPSSP